MKRPENGLLSRSGAGEPHRRPRRANTGRTDQGERGRASWNGCTAAGIRSESRTGCAGASWNAGNAARGADQAERITPGRGSDQAAQDAPRAARICPGRLHAAHNRRETAI